MHQYHVFFFIFSTDGCPVSTGINTDLTRTPSLLLFGMKRTTAITTQSLAHPRTSPKSLVSRPNDTHGGVASDGTCPGNGLLTRLGDSNTVGAPFWFPNPDRPNKCPKCVRATVEPTQMVPSTGRSQLSPGRNHRRVILSQRDQNQTIQTLRTYRRRRYPRPPRLENPHRNRSSTPEMDHQLWRPWDPRPIRPHQLVMPLQIGKPWVEIPTSWPAPKGWKIPSPPPLLPRTLQRRAKAKENKAIPSGPSTIPIITID